jgi:hypothetical protein
MKSTGLLVTDAGGFHAPQGYRILREGSLGSQHPTPVPKCEGPGAPSEFWTSDGTGAIRLMVEKVGLAGEGFFGLGGGDVADSGYLCAYSS